MNIVGAMAVLIVGVNSAPLYTTAFMKILPRTIKHERFKELIREWLDSHREEYCAFVSEVSRRDRQGVQCIFQYAQTIAPMFARMLMTHITDNRDDDLSMFEKVLADADIGTSILDDFQSQDKATIVPAMLAWLYFGQSWEMIVAYNEELIQEKDCGFFNRCMARLIIRVTIKQSVALEHRIKEDWEKFRQVQKSMGLALPVTDSTMPEFEEEAVDNSATDEVSAEKSEDTPKPAAKRGRKKNRASLVALIPDDTERLIERISKFVEKHSSCNHLAMLYIFLCDGSHICKCDITTFHNALNENFPEQQFVGVRGVQNAHRILTTPMKGGQRIIDFGDDKANFEMVCRHFEVAA